MASCVRNILTKNYQNLLIGFLVTFENVWDVFGDTAYADLPANHLPYEIIQCYLPPDTGKHAPTP